MRFSLNSNNISLKGALLGSFLFHSLFFIIISSSDHYTTSDQSKARTITATITSSSDSVQPRVEEELKIDNESKFIPDIAPLQNEYKPRGQTGVRKGVIPFVIPDRPAKILELGKIDIPIELSDYSGSMILDVDVDENGKVRAISIIYSNPTIIFDELVQSAIMSSKIEQAIQNGKPVSQIIRLEIKFLSNVLTIGG